MLRWSSRAPANVIVLRWQFSQGVLVVTCLEGFPIAPRPLWQVAQPLLATGWLNFVVPMPISLEFRPKCLALPARVVGPVTASPAVLNPGKFSGPVGGLAAVAGFAGPVVVVAVGFGAVIEVAGSDVAGRFVTAAGCFGGTDVPIALRIAAVTARTVAVNADLTAVATFVPGTGDFAVVVHVPADCLGLLQLVLVWQQPQSAVTLGWSLGFASAPCVPWVL